MNRRSLLAAASWLALAAAASAQPSPLGADAGVRYRQLGPQPTGGASLDLNFLSGAVDPRITLTRAAGGATYYDATGTLQLASANTGRIDYGPTPGGVTNWIRNSTAQGVIPGVVVGANPVATNWVAINHGSGATLTVSAITTAGVSGIRLAFTGTTSASPISETIEFESRTAIQTNGGQTWTAAFSYILSSGTLPVGMVTNSRILSFNSAATLVDNIIVPVANPTGILQRGSQTSTVGATAVNLTSDLHLLTWPASTAVNFTIDLFSPQLELGSVANTWVPTTTAPANVGATPLGLLIEEARTNGIRNPRAEGSTVGAIGSGGVAPTNWTASSSGTTGVVASIVGSGSENGVPYLDVSFVGTNSSGGTGFPSMTFETNTIAAVTGQTWAYSLNARLLSGTSPNLVFAISEVATAGGFLAQHNVVTGAVSTAPLSSQRLAGTFTLNQATCAWVGCFINFSVANGASVNCTLRIGAPQLEQGAFATSPILPAIGTPAATTRALDVASVLVASWFNAAAGSLAFEYDSNRVPAAVVGGLTDGTFANSFYISSNNATATGAGAGGPATSGSVTLGVPNKIAGSYVAGTIAVSANGAAAGTNTLGAGPFVWNASLGIGDSPWGAGNNLNGHMRRVRYWPRALAAFELQQVTT